MGCTAAYLDIRQDSHGSRRSDLAGGDIVCMIHV